MDRFAVSHFSDDGLLHNTKMVAGQDSTTTAVLLSRLAEIDARKLYLREGYPSMHAYCTHELPYCEGAASKRIYAARAARRFPVILEALAEGQVHLSAVVMLGPHLTSGNVDELLSAATHKTRARIELLLAGRFPRPDLPERLQSIPAPLPFRTSAAAEAEQHSPGNVDASTFSPGQEDPRPVDPVIQRFEAIAPEQDGHEHVEASPTPPVDQLGPARVESPALRPKVTPLAPERFGLQVTIDQETRDLLQHVRALMSHEVPTGEMALVLKAALKLAAAQLEKRKFAATDRPRDARRGTSPRHIPAAVKRAVRERDGGQCAFVSDSGRRCPARTFLEFDHAEPVARGGEATAENLRLVCRAHNQHAAERTFGAEFMERKRAEARRAGRGIQAVHRADG